MPLLLLLAALLVGCGQTGDLYLPEPEATAPQPSPPADEPSPDDERR